MKKLGIALMMSLMVPGLVYGDEIKVEGGGTIIATVFTPYKELFERDTGHNLTIVQSSAVRGLIALADGKVDVAAGAHPLDDLIAGAAKDGRIIGKEGLIATPIEENVLIAVVNKSNPVKSLTAEQLKGIFSGKIRNWKEVGGANLPIVVVWGTETEGQNVQFTRVVLKGEPMRSRKLDVNNYRNISEAVSADPSRVGIIPLGMNSPITRKLKIPNISSPMFLITNGAPSKNVQQFIDFYRKETNLSP